LQDEELKAEQLSRENSKHEYRNPKQIQIIKIQNHKTH
jgi:hypothetical protein